jgi:hypothetical protein
MPLGGTSLFFRRDALERMGGWDAHNVTEDADLGIRLARHGYRTEMIDSVTEEEANCRAARLGAAAVALDQGLHDDLGRSHARPGSAVAPAWAARLSGISGAVPRIGVPGGAGPAVAQLLAHDLRPAASDARARARNWPLR